jgi:hypothetical protein
MVRGIAGVVVGALFWMAGFYVLATMLAQLWPDYAVHARQWTRQGAFTFPPFMACCNLVFWVLADCGAGWVAAKIAQRREAPRVLAGLLGMYLLVMHLVLYWSRFPWWYNLGVVIPVVPAVLFGGRLANLRRVTVP